MKSPARRRWNNGRGKNESRSISSEWPSPSSSTYFLTSSCLCLSFLTRRHLAPCSGRCCKGGESSAVTHVTRPPGSRLDCEEDWHATPPHRRDTPPEDSRGGCYFANPVSLPRRAHRGPPECPSCPSAWTSDRLGSVFAEADGRVCSPLALVTGWLSGEILFGVRVLEDANHRPSISGTAVRLSRH